MSSDEDEVYYYSDEDSADGDYQPYEPEEKQTQAEFRIISASEIRMEQKKLVDDVSAVLALPKASAGVVLRFFRWNKEKLFDKYYADPEGVKLQSGVQFLGEGAGASTESVMCKICCSESSETFALGCEHRFCRACWEEYLRIQVAEGAPCIFTTCPMFKCKEVVNEEVFRAILGGTAAQTEVGAGSGASASATAAPLTSDSGSSESKAEGAGGGSSSGGSGGSGSSGGGDAALLARYEHYLLQSFVDINSSIKWCPGKDCGSAIQASGAVSVVKCSCGQSFCFKCTEEAHAPLTCSNLGEWMMKCRNESETANWILAHTKKCPECMTRIEKNQGCNHMSCRRCKHEFCWICMGPWSTHGPQTGGYYKCNRYNEGEEDSSKEEAASAKKELDRYLHYYKRYAAHDQSLRFAERQMGSTEQRMATLQSSARSAWIDVQFLQSATEVLIECRRVLKYSYPFAYYLPPGREKALFEYLQCELERNTEHLAGLSEAALHKMDRAEVINYTRVTKKFLDNLIQGVEEGLTS